MSDVNESVQAEPTGDIAGAQTEPMEAPEPAGIADWRDSLPGDIRSSIDVESVEDLAKGYVNAQQMIGGSIRIPGKEAGKEDWDKFYSAMAKACEEDCGGSLNHTALSARLGAVARHLTQSPGPLKCWLLTQALRKSRFSHWTLVLFAVLLIVSPLLFLYR